MRYISAQPDDDYFIWQLKVQMNNFRKHNIEKDAVILLGYDEAKGINPNAKKFIKQTKATVLCFSDKRTPYNKIYISTIRPNLLKQYYDTNPVSDDTFYHDSDILFTSSLPDFETLIKKEKLIVSDTISYVGATYIKSKGEELLKEMCAVVEIDPKHVEDFEIKTGGAQYLIPKNFFMNNSFWDKIERDSVNLFVLMNNTASKYNPSHPIQSWTADMWAVLWNFWKCGIDSEISKELDFSWPTFGIADWDKYKIFHNAGVTPDRKDLFFKGDFTHKSPFKLKHKDVNKNFCSYRYVEEIIDTAKNF